MKKRNKYCYHCNEVIEDDSDLEKIKVPSITERGVRNNSKNLHSECVALFMPQLLEIIEEAKQFGDVKLSENSVAKCYHCGSKVEERQLIKKDVPLHGKDGVRLVERVFHLSCVESYLGNMDEEKVSKEENSWWEKCYEKAKEIMDIPDGVGLDSFFTMRLLGLRVGKYSPKGINVRGISRGYDFETIHYTMMFCTVNISHAFSTMNFKDQKHKIDYAMKIITNNINFISQQVELKRKSDRRLVDVEVEDKTSYEDLYHNKTDKKQGNKITSVVESIIGSDSNELSDIDDMFAD